MTPKRVTIVSAPEAPTAMLQKKIKTLATISAQVTIGVRRVWLWSRIGITFERYSAAPRRR